MIFLSAGMPRSGSAWYYNLTHDLLVASGGQDARSIRRSFGLQNFLTEVNCNIRTLRASHVGPVLVPALLGKIFAIKTHSLPNGLISILMRLRQVRSTYIYRDPRDALVSAFEYGHKATPKGLPTFFSKLKTFEDAVDFMLYHLTIWDQWMRYKGVLHIRYEDMVTNYEDESKRLIKFLGIEGSSRSVQRVIDQYQPQKASFEQHKTHFNKGEIGRFRNALSSAQQQVCARTFGSYIQRMGYEI